MPGRARGCMQAQKKPIDGPHSIGGGGSWGGRLDSGYSAA
jgi:hypothetical protein